MRGSGPRYEGKQDPGHQGKRPPSELGCRRRRRRLLRMFLQGLFRSQKPRSEVVHQEAVERKRQKTQIAEYGHFENFILLHNGEGVIPFSRGPKIPKFPKPAAHPTGEKKGKEASRVPARQVGFEGRKSQA